MRRRQGCQIVVFVSLAAIWWHIWALSGWFYIPFELSPKAAARRTQLHVKPAPIAVKPEPTTAVGEIEGARHRLPSGKRQRPVQYTRRQQPQPQPQPQPQEQLREEPIAKPPTLRLEEPEPQKAKEDVMPQCHVMQGTELHGEVVRWGADFIVPSAAACCEACQTQAQLPTML